MKGKKLANMLLSALLVIFLVIGLAIASSALTPRGLFVAEIPESAAGGLELTNYKVKEELGNIVTASFKISNKSAVEVKDIKVSCDFRNEQGRFLCRKTWLLPGTLASGASTDDLLQDRRFIHTDAKTIKCRISDVKAARPTFFSVHRSAGLHGGAEAGGHGGGHGSSDAQAAHH